MKCIMKCENKYFLLKVKCFASSKVYYIDHIIIFTNMILEPDSSISICPQLVILHDSLDARFEQSCPKTFDKLFCELGSLVFTFSHVCMAS